MEIMKEFLQETLSICLEAVSWKKFLAVSGVLFHIACPGSMVLLSCCNCWCSNAENWANKLIWPKNNVLLLRSVLLLWVSSKESTTSCIKMGEGIFRQQAEVKYLQMTEVRWDKLYPGPSRHAEDHSLMFLIIKNSSVFQENKYGFSRDLVRGGGWGEEMQW